MAEKRTLDEILAEKLPQEALEGVRAVSLEVRVVAEDPVVRDSRTQREESEAYFERLKRFIGFLVAVLGVVAVCTFCFYVLISADFSADDKKWAQTVVSALLAGFVGYVFGKR